MMTKKEKHKVGNIYGNDIKRLDTIGSWYADGYIYAYDTIGGKYKIHVNELIKLFKGQWFCGYKARKYIHLEVLEN